MIKAHIYSTDLSALKLATLSARIEVCAVIIPENRLGSIKVNSLSAATNFPIFIHEKGGDLRGSAPAADIAISWFYSQLLSDEILRRYKYGGINMHGGRIPEYRGASVLQWAILNGEANVWATWHEMLEEVDSGVIWGEKPIPIHPDMNATHVRERLVEAGFELFDTTLRRKFSDKKCVRRPDLSQGVVWPQRRPRDSEIPSGLSLIQLQNFLRALPAPWPSPFLNVAGGVLKISEVLSSGAHDEDNVIPYQTSDVGEVLLKIDYS